MNQRSYLMVVEVEKATSGFRAKFEKLPCDSNYIMNHTAGVFLIDADRRFTEIIDFHEERRFASRKSAVSCPEIKELSHAETDPPIPAAVRRVTWCRGGPSAARRIEFRANIEF